VVAAPPERVAGLLQVEAAQGRRPATIDRSRSCSTLEERTRGLRQIMMGVVFCRVHGYAAQNIRIAVRPAAVRSSVDRPALACPGHDQAEITV